MSRDIRFRAWHKYYGEFIPWDRLGPGCFSDEDYVVQQFTGCYDKNGKEIYEGDIIHYFHDDSYKVTSENLVCVYDPSNAWFGFAYNLEEPAEGYYWQEIKNYCEVIANIFDAPHLLSK
jgi:uncharacterized phage protein (TIGR01671 family)